MYRRFLADVYSSIDRENRPSAAIFSAMSAFILAFISSENLRTAFRTPLAVVGSCIPLAFSPLCMSLLFAIVLKGILSVAERRARTIPEEGE